MPAIDVPGQGTVDFPDTMTDDQIKSVIKRKFFTPPSTSPLSEKAVTDTKDWMRTMVLQNPRGLIEPGNIDLYHRPVIQNADGSVSSVRSQGIGIDGREVLLPSVSGDGRNLTVPEMVDIFKKTHQHLGIFDNPANATSYAEILHQQQNQLYGPHGLMQPKKEAANGAAPPAPDDVDPMKYFRSAKEFAGAVGEELKGPLEAMRSTGAALQAPRWEPSGPGWVQPFVETVNLPSDVWNFVTTPEGLASIGAFEFGGPYVRALLRSGFSAQAVQSLGQQLRSGDVGGATQSIAMLLGIGGEARQAVPAEFAGKAVLGGEPTYAKRPDQTAGPVSIEQRLPVVEEPEREVKAGDTRDTLAEQTKAQEQPPAVEVRPVAPTIKPESEAAVERGRVEQNVRSMAEQIYQSAFDEQKLTGVKVNHPLRVEQAVAMQRLAAQARTNDPVVLQAFSEAHRLATEQADLLPGVGMERQARWIEMGEAPGLQAPERLPPGVERGGQPIQAEPVRPGEFAKPGYTAIEPKGGELVEEEKGQQQIPPTVQAVEGEEIGREIREGVRRPDTAPRVTVTGGAPPAPPTAVAQNAAAFSTEDFLSAASRGRLHTEIGRDIPAEAQAENPFEMGVINGYSIDDIAHFYKRVYPNTGYKKFVADAKRFVAKVGETPPARPTAPEPPPTAPAPPQPVGGVSIEAMAQRPIVPPEPGHGVNWDESTRRGEAALDSGADPRRLIADFRATGAISQPVMDTMRAQMLRLQARTNFAGDALRAKPNDKGLLARYQAALANEQSFADAYKPMHTVASNTLRSVQGTEPLTEDMAASYTGLQRKFRELNPGKDFDPQQTARADQIANGMKRANLEYAQANGELYRQMDGEYKRIKTTRKGPPTIEDLGRIFGEGLDEVCDV